MVLLRKNYSFGVESLVRMRYYKNNYRRVGIRVVNARPKVIIFCKSRPSNCIWKRVYL